MMQKFTMQDDDPSEKLAVAMVEIQAGRAALDRAATALEQALQTQVNEGVNALPISSVLVTEHRRQHRSGRAPKIANDPELQTFIVARIDRMTFAEIASDVAQHFPPSRRVGKSAVHDWWKREGRPGRSGA